MTRCGPHENDRQSRARTETLSALHMTTHTIRFTLNGEPVTTDVAPHHNLVELLQQKFDLYGARESCSQGLCGCCTVLIEGVAVSGCLYLALLVDGKEVRTIESFAQGQQLTPVQEAFVETGAFQCGFCTPGFILMTSSCLPRIRTPTTMKYGTISREIFAAAPPILKLSRP